MLRYETGCSGRAVLWSRCIFWSDVAGLVQKAINLVNVSSCAVLCCTVLYPSSTGVQSAPWEGATDLLLFGITAPDLEGATDMTESSGNVSVYHLISGA
jgi:hypothetical protein